MQTTLRKRSALLLILPMSLFAVVNSSAQSPGATVEVLVRSAEDLRPLSGARVMIEGIGTPAMTNANGFLSITELPPGSRRIEVRYLGYETTSGFVSLIPGERVRAEFRMQIQPIQLTEVNVRARADVLTRRGFYDRQKGGTGTFLTRGDITRFASLDMSDVLRRVPGIRAGGVSAKRSASFGGSSRACPIQYYVNGAMAAQFNINDVMPADVEGLEIYLGASSVPPMYNKGTSSCGVILVWTRID